MATTLVTGQLTDFANAVVAGGKVFFYEAGTTTPRASYTTSALSVANANPVVADASGRFVAWIDSTLGDYKIVATNSAVSQTYFSVDNITPGDNPVIVIYPGGIGDQLLLTTSSVTFADVTLADDLVVGDDASVAGDLTVTGDVTATGDVSGDAGTFSGAVSGTTGTFSGLITGGAGAAITGNITVTGTVDGVDVAALKTDFDNSFAAYSSLVPGSTGAVLLATTSPSSARTAINLDQVIVADEYSAIGDGATDDTTAIRNALSADTQKPVVLTEGKIYAIDATIAENEFPRFVGGGALKLPSGDLVYGSLTQFGRGQAVNFNQGLFLGYNYATNNAYGGTNALFRARGSMRAATDTLWTFDEPLRKHSPNVYELRTGAQKGNFSRTAGGDTLTLISGDGLQQYIPGLKIALTSRASAGEEYVVQSVDFGSGTVTLETLAGGTASFPNSDNVYAFQCHNIDHISVEIIDSATTPKVRLLKNAAYETPQFLFQIHITDDRAFIYIGGSWRAVTSIETNTDSTIYYQIVGIDTSPGDGIYDATLAVWWDEFARFRVKHVHGGTLEAGLDLIVNKEGGWLRTTAIEDDLKRDLHISGDRTILYADGDERLRLASDAITTSDVSVTMNVPAGGFVAINSLVSEFAFLKLAHNSNFRWALEQSNGDGNILRITSLIDNGAAENILQSFTKSTGAVAFPYSAGVSIAGPLTLTTKLAVAQGGTGASDAATARANLGANDAANLTTGTVADARLSSNVPLKNAANTLAENLTIDGGANSRGLVVSGSNTPFVRLKNAAATTDTKGWRWAVGADGAVSFQSLNDADAFGADAYKISRSGTAVTEMRVYAASLRIDGNIDHNGSNAGFFGATPVAQQSITGALSSVSDSNAQTVLTAIVGALSNLGLATDSTT